MKDDKSKESVEQEVTEEAPESTTAKERAKKAKEGTLTHGDIVEAIKNTPTPFNHTGKLKLKELTDLTNYYTKQKKIIKEQIDEINRANEAIKAQQENLNEWQNKLQAADRRIQLSAERIAFDLAASVVPRRTFFGIRRKPEKILIDIQHIGDELKSEFTG